MLRYLIKRVFWALALLLAITFVTFLVFRVIPGNAAELAAGPSASPADVKRVERALALDRPVYVQYGKFLWRLVGDGSLGRSFVTREEVNDVVLDAAPVTASVVLGGIALLLLIGVVMLLPDRAVPRDDENQVPVVDFGYPVPPLDLKVPGKPKRKAVKARPARRERARVGAGTTGTEERETD